MRFLIPLLLFSVGAVAQGFSDASAPFLLSTSTLRKGLVGYWRLEEGTGTRYDCSQYGSHLTANNSPTNAAGIVGNACNFVSASSQWLSASTKDAVNLNSYNNYTIAFWCQLSSPSGYPNPLSKDNINTVREFGVYYDVGITKWNFYVGNGAGSVTVVAGPSVANNTNWNFIACGMSNSASLWISVNNGALYTQNLGVTPGTGTNYFRLGGVGSGTYMNGSVDEVGAWNRALTSNEITYLYNSGKGTHFPWAHP